jgi:N-acetylneuraminic acid mutarotase
MKSTISLVLVLALSLIASVADADFTWARKTDMPTNRYLPSTSVVRGKIYAIGGWNTIGEWNPQWEALRRVDEYDPTTDTWTRKADMPTGRGHAETCVVNEKIYVVGYDSDVWPVPPRILPVEVYDPATDTWAQKADMPTRRCWYNACVVDGIIYVIGGWNGKHTGIVEAYDTATDTWTRKADMPTARSFSATCVLDGNMYVIGGGAPGKSAVEVYDPATDTWTKKADLPTARYCLDAVVIDGKIYAIGGWYFSIGGPIYSTVEVYDPVTDTWTKGVDIPVTTAGFISWEELRHPMTMSTGY